MTPEAALARILRDQRGRLLAALIARTGDFQRAEDSLQEASASALVHWARAGVPDNPAAWLLRAGLRKAIDAFRREGALRRHRDALELLAREEAAAPDPEAIPDERLRLIFTCCHPALEEKTRIALTLRSLCGLSTAEVAAVFLDHEAAMGQRLTRAKAKIRAARLPFAIPAPDQWEERLNSVLTVLYLVYTAGYRAEGQGLRAEAIFLARLSDHLRPGEAEVEGCLAMLLLTEARAAARVDAAGLSVPMGEQDRGLWDQAALAEGRALLARAVARRAPGPFQIKAAIADCHMGERGSDWAQIRLLFRRLLPLEPTPVIRLSLAVAEMECGDTGQAAAMLDGLAGPLDDYQPYHAARAELCRRRGDRDGARAGYARAIALAPSEPERRFLEGRLALCDRPDAD